MHTTFSLPPGVVSTGTLSRLERFVSAPPRSSLVVLESSSMEAMVLAGRALGEALLPDEHARATDLKVAEPDGDRWTIGEVDEKVIAPSAYIPVALNVVVVSSAEAMDRPAAEHLLKTVEEPPSPTLFVFCTPAAALLLPTLQGRAGMVLRIDPAPTSERLSALVSSDMSPALAEDLLSLAGSSPSLVSAVSSSGDVVRDGLLGLLRRLEASPLGDRTPSSTAFELTAALEVLAAAAASALSGKEVKAARGKGALSPRERSQVRLLLRSHLSRWRRQESARLRTVSTPADLEVVVRRLEALDRAELEVSSFAPVQNVLAALLSRS